MQLRSSFTPTTAAPTAAWLVALALAGAACAEGSAVEDGTTSGPGSSGGGSPPSGAGGDGGSSGDGPTTGTGPGTPTSTSASPSSGPGGGDGGAGGDGSGGDRAAGGGGGGATTTTTSTGGGVDRLCPDGQFVTSVAADGALTCAPFGTAALTAIAGGCSIYLGHRDGCTGCTTGPAKWGWARTGSCANGVGAGGTCVDTSLNGNLVSLYGLNTTGDVDENDKLYASFHCAVGDVAPQPGPCAAGSFASGIVDGVVTCTPASGLALGRVRTTCHLYLGWIDNCSGCTTAPSKWGKVDDAACANGAGTGNTCTTAVLGGETVRLFGLNTGGDVDENDKIHLGLRCDDAAEEMVTAVGACPAGLLVHGVDADGTLRCASPAPDTTAVFRERCSAYLGWRDGCTTCTDPPSKWGIARPNGCANGTGVNNTCAAVSLGGDSVSLFGLNTGGNVDENDKFHVGFECE